MIAYFIVFALFGVIIVQAVIYYRERARLYDILKTKNAIYSGSDKSCDTKKQRRRTGHKKALNKWRNGGDND